MILLSLLIAAFWGAAHALTPGTARRSSPATSSGPGAPIDAVLLGGIVTITHTIGVFALGFVTLLLSRFIVPETLYPWLTLTSGLLVVAVGGSVLFSGARRRGHHHHGHSHEHGHHHHDHNHDRRGLLGVGIAAGLLPCPSALVVLLSAIALHRVGFGLALIVAFSLGLAATITSIGLVAVLASGLRPHLARRAGHPSSSRRECARDPLGRTRHHAQGAPGGDLAMFGLDDHIAAMSNGGSFSSSSSLRCCSGSVTRPTPTTSPPSRARRLRTRTCAPPRGRARRLLGLGHALTLIVFGLPILLFEAYLPERLQQGAETAVAALIVFLAVRLLIRWRSGYFHLHAHRTAPTTRDTGTVRTPVGAFGIGLVHGMGGSAGVGVLLLAAIPSKPLARSPHWWCWRFHGSLDDHLTTGFGATLGSAPVQRRSPPQCPRSAR